jgi:hypothetical protein
MLLPNKKQGPRCFTCSGHAVAHIASAELPCSVESDSRIISAIELLVLVVYTSIGLYIRILPALPGPNNPNFFIEYSSGHPAG